MYKRPKVSVIIATHNNAENIGDCVDSLWSRSFSEIDVIVVDVNSTDGTKDVLANMVSDEQIIFLADSTGSIGHAKNMGVDRARGDYIVFVEPKDFVHRNALEYMSLKLDDSPDADMFSIEIDCIGDDSYGRTAEDRRKSIGNANSIDPRRQEMDSRVVRYWIFESFTMYRKTFLREYDIHHYDVPGYGRQSDAFCFLAMAKGIPSVSVDIYYSRNMDIQSKLITDSRVINDFCSEYKYLRDRLREDSKKWWTYRLVYWQTYYDRAMLLYERLSDDLKSVFSKRMQADIRGAVLHKEYSEEHFDIRVRDEMQLLMKSTPEFDRYQAERIKKRKKERDVLLRREDRISEIAASTEENELERLSKESAQRIRERRKKNRLDRAWLMDEMARDMAPLRLLLGLTTDEMGKILGLSESTYKSIESGKREISWDQYMALLFIFRYNDRTAPVTDTLGLYPDPLKNRIRKGVIINYE